MTAAESAARDAARQRDLADELARRAGIATQMARTFDAAARSEHRLAETLIELEPLGYAMLTGRLRPGSRTGTLDLVLVGPGGVILVDSSAWRGVTIHDGRLFRGGTEVTDELAAYADLVYTTQRALAEIGLAAGEVHAFAAFAGQAVPRTDVYGVALLSEAAVVTEIARLGARLTPQQVAVVRGVVENLFRPAASDPAEIDATTRPPLTAGEIAASGIPALALPHDPTAGERQTPEQIRAAQTEGRGRPALEG
ncbi:MAG: nuclease-related domain-containing protein, partial [Pseudolysinimonas sp.]